MDFSIFDSFDYSIFTFFGEKVHDVINLGIVEFFTFFGGSDFVTPMTVIAAILILFKKTRKPAMAVFFAVIVGTLLTNLILKDLFARPRPFNYYADDPVYMAWYQAAGSHFEKSFSFPSGHTTAAFEMGIALFLALNKKYSWICPVFATFVGLSRIYLMVHYPTDVIGGVIVGTIAGVAGYFIMKAIMKATDKTKFKDFDIINIFKKKKA